MAMSLTVYVPMLTLAVMALTVRTFHYASSAYAMARVSLPVPPMPVPIAQRRREDRTQDKNCGEENAVAHIIDVII